MKSYLKGDDVERITKIFFAAFIFLFLFWLILGYLTYIDFYGQWAICAYGIRGIDPYLITGKDIVLIKEIGEIPNEWGTSPWGILLGNFFYPGFLKYEYAKIYFFVLNVVLLFITERVLKNAFLNVTKFDSKRIVFYLTLLSLDFYMSLFLGNAGGAICCLTIIACAICEKRPILSGICLSLAMVKPQIALLVCFAFLIEKKFKPLFVAAIIDIASWGLFSFMVKTSPLTLLKELFEVKVGGKNRYFGIFSLIGDAFPNLNDTVLLFLGMVVGIVFVYILNTRMHSSIPVILRFVPAFITLTWWSYTWCNDRFVMIVPSIIAFIIFSTEKARKERIKWAIISFLLYFEQAFYIVARSISTRSVSVYFKSSPYGESFKIGCHLEYTIYAIVLIVLSVLIVKKLNEIYSKKEEYLLI